MPRLRRRLAQAAIICSGLFCIGPIWPTNSARAQQAAAEEQPAARAPMPDDAAQKAAQAGIREIFAAGYAKAKKPAEKVELARTLLGQAADSADDRASQFVLYSEARQLALAGNEWQLAFEAIESAAAIFEFSPDDWRYEAISSGAKHLPADGVGREELIDRAVELAKAAAAANQISLAEKYAGVASTALAKVKDVQLKKRITSELTDLKAQGRQSAAAQKARDTLKTTPDDPAANALLGRYLCVNRGEWEAGLPFLAKGGDGKLAAAARLDQAGKSPAARSKAGDAWWDLAEAEKGAAKRALEHRAETCYREALDKLEGLAKVKIEKRLKSIEESATVEPIVESAPAKKKGPTKARFAGRSLLADVKPNTPNLEIAVAERVLKAGGTLLMNWSGSPASIQDPTRLQDAPPGATVSTIAFEEPSGITDADLSVLAKLKNLSSLKLFDAPISDAGFSKIASFKLGRLALVNASITDKSLAAIAEMPLVELDISGNPISDAGLAKLTTLRLQSLGIGNTRVTAKGLEHLKSFTTLNSIDVTGLALGEAEYACLANVRLNGLIFGCKNTTPGGIGQLVGRSNVSWLIIRDTKLSDAAAQEIAKFPRITSITLRNCAVSEAGLKSWATLPNLNSLVVRDTPFSENHVAALGVLDKLFRLEFKNTKITGEGFRKWQPRPKLTMFLATNSRLSDAGAQAAASVMPNLSDVQLQHNGFHEKGLSAFVQLPKVNFIGVSSQDFPQETRQRMQSLNSRCVVTIN